MLTQFRAALADGKAKAIVVICAGRRFSAGADIKEFEGPMKAAPLLENLAQEDRPFASRNT